MKANEIITMNNGSLRRLSEGVNHVAFMDDANLLSDNKEGPLLLLVLYTICQSFVKLCNIKANPKKFELLVVGKDRKESEDQEYLILDDTKIRINRSEGGEIFRYTTIRISNATNYNSHNIFIESSVKKMINFMRWKKLTAKECILIWNTVMIPMIEYQLQCTVLTDTLIERLDSKIRDLIKRNVVLIKICWL